MKEAERKKERQKVYLHQGPGDFINGLVLAGSKILRLGLNRTADGSRRVHTQLEVLNDPLVIGEVGHVDGPLVQSAAVGNVHKFTVEVEKIIIIKVCKSSFFLARTEEEEKSITTREHRS